MLRLLPAVALCVALTGCQPQSAGTDSPSTTSSTQPTSTTTTTLGVAESTVAFAGCLSERQVDLPETTAGEVDLAILASAPDTTDPAVRAAIADCAPLLTPAQVARLTNDFEVRELVADQLARFSECMRAEGIADFPDPVTDPVPGYDLERVPFEADGFEIAVETCGAPIGSFGLEQ